MSGNYKYGTKCYICHDINPNGRYLSHESRMYFCGKHSNEEIRNFQSMPEDTSRAKRRKIITNSTCPPIPVRDYDWQAVTDNYDGPGSPIGYGRTEQEAIINLEEKLNEDLSDTELIEYADRHKDDHGNEGKICRFFLRERTRVPR